jgi:thiamine transporter ThiT
MALAEPKSAEASLWAVFIISVTTGATAGFFHQLLQGLFQDLQLRSWFQVRNILLDFIYPVSFLDEPCKSYFDSLQPMQVGVA